MSKSLRRVVLVLGDQLWLGNPALQGFDALRDRVLMIEAPGEGTQVWSHKVGIPDQRDRSFRSIVTDDSDRT
ncbi:MAG: cryptochrome/photolyase family protein [Acidovorax sp.]|nr:cryptochrome/photolyase family protein [Acidovorax sp.]